jgi:hypothetical protein
MFRRNKKKEETDYASHTVLKAYPYKRNIPCIIPMVKEQLEDWCGQASDRRLGEGLGDHGPLLSVALNF